MRAASKSAQRCWVSITRDVGQSFNNLAALYFAQRDWARAAEFWRLSTAVIIRRAQLGGQDNGQALTGKRKAEAQQLNWEFWGLVKATRRLAEERGSDVELKPEMFQTVQWALASEAAQSLAEMAARGAKGDPALAQKVREQQDLVAEWQALRRGAHRCLVAARGQAG